MFRYSFSYPHPRPNPKTDVTLPVVVVAVFDVSGLYNGRNEDPKLLFMLKRHTTDSRKDSWSFPTALIDNLHSRKHGVSASSALFQARIELANQGLFDEDFVPETQATPACMDHYLFDDREQGKKLDIYLVATQVIRPESVYVDSEHIHFRWIPVGGILANRGIVPKNCIDHLFDDLDRLQLLMQSLHNQWGANIAP